MSPEELELCRLMRLVPQPFGIYYEIRISVAGIRKLFCTRDPVEAEAWRRAELRAIIAADEEMWDRGGVQ